MKNESKENSMKNWERSFGQRVVLEKECTCKDILNLLFKEKERFHALRKYIDHNYQLMLNASLLSKIKESDKLKKHTEKCQKELKLIEEDISRCEKELEDKLSAAHLSLEAAIGALVKENEQCIKESSENKAKENEESKRLNALIKDAITLIDDMKTLKTNNSIKARHGIKNYPQYFDNVGIFWDRKNQTNLKDIKKVMALEEKIDVGKKNLLINQYAKVVTSAKKVMSHEVYNYKQSLRTAIINVVEVISVFGLLVGAYSKINGGNFFMWEKIPKLTLYKQEGDLLREAGDILGINKNPMNRW